MSYTKKQVSEIIGLSMRAIQYYTERTLITPEIDLGEGKGQNRKYSKKNLFEFGIIKALSEYGMAFAQVKTIFEMIDFARYYGVENPFIVIYKVESGSGFVYQWSKDLELDKHYKAAAESMLIINMGKIFAKVKRA